MQKKYNVSVSTIDDIRNHKTWKHLTSNYHFEPQINNDKKRNNKFIDVYDLQGNFIGTYESAREVERILGVPYKNVSQVCNGERRQSHGYICRFKDEPFDKYEIKTKYTYVDQYTLDKKFIKTFESMGEAGKSVDSTGATIGHALNSKSHFSKGYLWLRHGEHLN